MCGGAFFPRKVYNILKSSFPFGATVNKYYLFSATFMVLCTYVAATDFRCFTYSN